jgi:hypothetical protein
LDSFFSGFHAVGVLENLDESGTRSAHFLQTVARWLIPLKLVSPCREKNNLMARNEQAYAGERRTAGLRVQFTPAERQQLETAATVSGARLERLRPRTSDG